MLDDIPLVNGEIIFSEEVQSFSGATAYVRLEDVSQVDATSKLFKEQVFRNISHEVGETDNLIFNLYGQAPDNKASYVIRVHLDLDGDGQVSRGDYITMESYPVLTYGYPNQVLVRVRKVE